MALVRLVKVYQLLQPSPSLLVEHKNLKDFLCLEGDCAVILKTSDGNYLKNKSTKLLDAYGCLGALQLNKSAEGLGCSLAFVTGCKNIGRILDQDIYRVTDVSFISIRNASIESSGCASEMKRLLCNGSFYFMSSAADESCSLFITQSLQSNANKEREEFLWNRNQISYFSIRGIPCRTWFIHVMCGGVDIRTFYVGSQQGRVAVINRLSCERVGTRYNVRGVDDAGNVANFVESEQIICIGEVYSSFIMTRGSVPLFWEQPGLNVGSHKVKMPFCFDVSFQAYERHFAKFLQTYSKCCLVNLLGSKEGEASLSRYYRQHHESSRYSSEIPFLNFDYHNECRAGRMTNITKLMSQLNPILDQHGVTYHCSDQGAQLGVLRVNCLDCLDRTNSVQTHVGIQMAAKQLAFLGHSDNSQLLARVTEPLKAIWQHTGDLISRMYAGTGALEGKDAVGKLKDGAKSLSRSIQNNFLDQGKQETMDLLLRVPFHRADLYHISRTLLTQSQFRSSSTTLLRNIYMRRMQFCDDIRLRICVGTWNVNGGKLFRSIAYKNQTLKDWLIVDEGEATRSYYQALYEYNSNEDGDLCLSLNDVVIVDYHLEEGEWLHGFKGDQEGIFPAGYVQELKNPHVVLHDFPAQQEGDLHLIANEVVDVTGQNGEWLNGVIYRDGQGEEGTFPANFVEKLEKNGNTPVDLYAIGFEEMVELNAGNIVNASLANQQAWASELQKTLPPAHEYTLVASEQLVGVCLFVFVRKPLVAVIREVSVSTIKTGMGGTTGNKGAVAISFALHDSSLCFVCSHFAAGQTQVQERNSDFEEISGRLNFLKHRPLLYHDYIFWCGDFNYRIDLTGDEVKELVKAQAWEKLRENDQLLVQKNMGNVFKGFNEGQINFAPTYKYDLFSDDYDTSEKCRVPAWTDRVLWRRKKWLCEEDQESEVHSGTLVSYNRAELKTSDHRPVMAVLDVVVTSARDEDRARLYGQLSASLHPIYFPVYVYVEGKPCDETLCTKFIDSLNVAAPSTTRIVPGSLLVVFPEAWMVEDALKHDGSFFEGKQMKMSRKNDNVVDEVAAVTPQAETNGGDDVSIHSAENVQTNTSHFHASYSSVNLSALPHHSMVRPSSTPALSDLAASSAPSPASTPTTKKRPPRPPAISNVRLRPGGPSAAISPETEVPSSTVSIDNGVSMSKTASSRTTPEQESLGSNWTDTQTNNKTPEVIVPPNAFPDLSNWRLDNKPPKIKPRKTVPKRRAPVPPNFPTPTQRNNKPAPAPPPPTSSSISGSLIDSFFESSQSMPPLIPCDSSFSSAPTNPSLLSSFDPLSLEPFTSNKPPPPVPNRAAPLVPSKANSISTQANDPFGDLDPWSSSVSNASQINKSFTTDFTDFDFQSKQ